MTKPLPIPEEHWSTAPAAARTAFLAVIERPEQRIADLEERLNRDSTNPSKPLSSDPPAIQRCPPAPPSGKRPGGQLGHPRHARPLIAPDRLRHDFEAWPSRCRCCGDTLPGMTPSQSVIRSPSCPRS